MEIKEFTWNVVCRLLGHLHWELSEEETSVCWSTMVKTGGYNWGVGPYSINGVQHWVKANSQ